MSHTKSAFLGAATLVACAGGDGSDVEKPRDTADSETSEDYDYACFVAGTRVHTPHGSVPIEQIGVGDLVWSWDVDGVSLCNELRQLASSGKRAGPIGCRSES